MEILTRLFELLFQGAAAGLIVLAATRYLQHRRETELARKYALLMYVEIYGHITAFEELIAASSCGRPIEGNITLNCLYEELAMPYLTSLPIDELQKIAIYYQSVLSINRLLMSREEIPPGDAVLTSISQTLQMAKGVNEILASHWTAYKTSHKGH